MRPSLLLSSILAVAAAASGAACSSTDTSDSSTTSGTAPTTAITVEPARFLGAVPCSNEEGALRSYVVTVFDQTAGTEVVTLPSSPPTSCSQGVQFRDIIVDHQYSAQIDGYEALAGSIEPAVSPASGSRHMVLKKGGAEVKPRWTGECTSIKAALNTEVVFTDCAALVDHASSEATSVIYLDPLAALGALRCAGAGGEVASFDITPQGSGLPAVTGVACGGEPIAFSAGIKPGEPYTFRLEARAEAGGPVVWGSSCYALPKEGLATTAVCDPLRDTGAIELSIDDLLKGAGVACGKEVSTYEASLTEPSLSTGPVACAEPARFAPLAAGAYTIDVRALGPDGTTVIEATCEATVLPGETSQATCKKL